MRSALALFLAAAMIPLPNVPPASARADAPIPSDSSDRLLNRPHVDVALLLDTSNSMDGLINQARTQLWTIVQQFANARKAGQTPILRVALFEYGNTALPATEGYIRQVVPLTDNLDQLSEALFALKTNGGDEYCGQVINEAVKRLDWSTGSGAYKAIFIAGNEPFTQGSVEYKSACTAAANRGVVVNTIHCGSRDQGISGMWQDGAVLGRGDFFNINQDSTLPDIACPQDTELGELNRRLNETYIWYGSRDDREYASANQAAQDTNAAESAPAAAAQRIAAKSSSAYSNAGRDLVDTQRQEPDVLNSIKDDELPDVMKKMSPEERLAYVKQQAESRDAIKQQIGKLAAERESYYQSELKNLQQGNEQSNLGDAVTQAVQKQLKSSGYEIESPAPAPTSPPN